MLIGLLPNLDSIVTGIGLAILAALILSAVTLVPLNKRPALAEIRSVAILIVAVAILGGVTGFAGGMSRTGVVGDIIPAVLTLVGGYAVYLFGADTSKGVLVALTTVAFAVALGLNYDLATQRRGVGERFVEVRTTCYSALTDGELLKDSAAFCRFAETMGPLCVEALHDQTRRVFPYLASGDVDWAARQIALRQQLEKLSQSAGC